MTKNELVQAIAAATGQSQAAASRSLEAFTRIVSEELAKGGEVAIAGFGTFKRAERAERTGRNPQTGEAIRIGASTSVKFSAASALKAALKPDAEGVQFRDRDS